MQLILQTYFYINYCLANVQESHIFHIGCGLSYIVVLYQSQMCLQEFIYFLQVIVCLIQLFRYESMFRCFNSIPVYFKQDAAYPTHVLRCQVLLTDVNRNQIYFQEDLATLYNCPDMNQCFFMCYMIYPILCSCFDMIGCQVLQSDFDIFLIGLGYRI